VIIGDALIYALGAVAIGGAAVVVLGRNLFHNVLAFTVMLVATAGLFGVMGSEFLAVVMVFVYVGGVVVLLLFGLMMTASQPGRPVKTESRHSIVALAAAVGLGGLVLPVTAFLGASSVVAARIPAAASSTAPAASAAAGDSVAALGSALLTTYAPAFEAVGVILLVSALAAILIVRRGEPGVEEPSRGAPS
jgi:NADH-quinone oxidoreductase subunit J